jgi:hypothetical protein
MATNENSGTNLVALETGGAWPARLVGSRNPARDIVAIVQGGDEPPKAFEARVLARLNGLVRTGSAPLRCILAPNAEGRSLASGAAYCLGRAVLGIFRPDCPGEFILWGGLDTDTQQRGHMLALAAALVQGHGDCRCMVRVLFDSERHAPRRRDSGVAIRAVRPVDSSDAA